MEEKIHETLCGQIHYWVNKIESNKSEFQLVFLPGLTADHRLFDKQIDYFKEKYSLLVWDAPGHSSSYPFNLTFIFPNKAEWLDEILKKEGFDQPVIIGQSIGGYVGQMYSQLYGDKLKGFISIDSAPLQREYLTNAEVFLLKRMEPVYRYFPWKALVKTGSYGASTTEYGRKMMHDMMMVYDGDHARFAKLTGYTYKILMDVYDTNPPNQLPENSLLICGEKDHVGSCVRYNKAWHNKTGIPIEWIKKAGHNSNADAPEIVNQLIENFVEKL